MPDITNKLVVVTITRDEARVWATGMERGMNPTMLCPPAALNSHHFRDDPKHHGRGDGPGVPRYYEEIVTAVGGASEILLIGHGHGKASAMLHFMQYLERNHTDLAELVVDAIDTNLIAMTEPEILALARGWFLSHSLV
jgi:hypothetical protein